MFPLLLLKSIIFQWVTKIVDTNKNIFPIEFLKRHGYYNYMKNKKKTM